MKRNLQTNKTWIIYTDTLHHSRPPNLTDVAVGQSAYALDLLPEHEESVKRVPEISPSPNDIW